MKDQWLLDDNVLFILDTVNERKERIDIRVLRTLSQKLVSPILSVICEEIDIPELYWLMLEDEWPWGIKIVDTYYRSKKCANRKRNLRKS